MPKACQILYTNKTSCGSFRVLTDGNAPTQGLLNKSEFLTQTRTLFKDEECVKTILLCCSLCWDLAVMGNLGSKLWTDSYAFRIVTSYSQVCGQKWSVTLKHILLSFQYALPYGIWIVPLMTLCYNLDKMVFCWCRTIGQYAKAIGVYILCIENVSSKDRVFSCALP